MLIVDSHEDLAWNMLTFGRDYTRSASDTRRLEVNSGIPSYNDDTLLGWPDYQRGRVGVIFATLFATPIRKQLGDWETQCYQDSEQAYRLYNQQLDAYHRLTEKHRDKFCLIVHNDDLDSVLTDWDGAGEDQNSPVGLVILMEGAEAIRDPRELDMWWERGLRLIGPAWAGTRFCGGTREPGPLTKEGFPTCVLDCISATWMNRQRFKPSISMRGISLPHTAMHLPCWRTQTATATSQIARSMVFWNVTQ
jgi:membrane dipeptidase